jgi:hypothetical protein
MARKLVDMACPAAAALFEDYARATVDFFEATDKLGNAVGQHGQFAAEKRHAEHAGERCRVARLALQEHWNRHNCRGTRY